MGAEEANRRVLYMEDDIVLGRFLKHNLEKSGFVVDIAEDGESGLKMLERQQYDILILDYRMPVLGGLEVLQRLSSLERILPVIMLTGFGDESVAVEALKLGADEYLVKDSEGGYVKLIPAIIEKLLRKKILLEEKERAVQELRREQKLFVDGPVVVFTCEAKESWPVAYVSSNISQLGYSAQDLMDGKIPFADIVFKDDFDALKQEILKKSEAGEVSFEYEYRVVKSDGSLGWVYNFFVLVLDDSGDMTHYDGYMLDITAKKNAQQELEKAKQVAEAATSLKDKFISLVTHDLRSPCGSMLGWLRMILTLEKEYPLNHKTRDIFQSVLRSGDAMVLFLEKLLKINRLKTGKIAVHPEASDVNFAAIRVMAEFSQKAKDKGIQLVNDIPKKSIFHVDPDLLYDLLLNLVSNAVEACQSGDTIRMFFPEGGSFVLAVSDTGEGISESIQTDIFEYGHKESRSAKKAENPGGLGLPLCNDIMKAHKGSITLLTGEPRRGTVFFLQFPDESRTTKPSSAL